MTAPDTFSQADFAAGLLHPDAPLPGGLVTWNGSDPRTRFAVYRNNVVTSLIDALAESFPVTQALTGPDFFRAMAAVHVRQSPPRSPVLALWGESFAEFVAGFPPAAGVPYLADMVRLEYARVRAFHAPDADPSHHGRPHPSAQLLRSRFAVVSLWAAHQGAGHTLEELATVDPDIPENALIVRSGLDVLVLAVDDDTSARLEAEMHS